MKEGLDGIQRKCVAGPLTIAVIAKAHKGVAGGHFLGQTNSTQNFNNNLLVANNE